MAKKITLKKYISTLSENDQRKLIEIEEEALQLMKIHAVDHYKFKFSMGKHYQGCCTGASLLLNIHYCLSSDRDKIRNTILHEIAHAIVGVHHYHRKIWQDKARELGVTWTRNYKE